MFLLNCSLCKHLILQRRINSREGDNDEVGSVEPLVLHEVGDKSNRLDGFSQTHLISQDPIQIIIVKRN